MMIRQPSFQPVLMGKPSDHVEVLPEPSVVQLPLTSRRLHFSAVKVRSRALVAVGDVLAIDPDHFGVPLLASIAGTTKVDEKHGIITIDGSLADENRPAPSAPETDAPLDIKQRVLTGGGWPFFGDAHTGAIPNPDVPPKAVLVTPVAADLYVARPDVILGDRTDAMMRGLDILKTLTGNAPIHVAIPATAPASFGVLRAAIRAIDGIDSFAVGDGYPDGHPALMARELKLAADPGAPVWTVSVAGVLALDTIVTADRPVVTRTFSVGGPGVTNPRHVRAAIGYPLRDIPDAGIGEGDMRIIDGGIMTGVLLQGDLSGLGVECDGITLLPMPVQRDFLGFLRPGFSLLSFSRCFFSALVGSTEAPATALLGGEPRACVACGYCEQACPADLLPQMLHRYLYANDVDAAAELGLELCIGCGLCSYVCPAKIELRQQFADAKQHLHAERAEMHANTARAT